MKAKLILFWIILVLCVQSLAAQVCSDPLNIIYGLDGNGNIVPINVNTSSVGAALTNSGDPGYPGSTSNSNSIGLAIQTSTFYFFQNNASGSQQFVSFNAITNTYTTLANSPISGSDVRGCVTADGTGYYCLDASGTLCYYNIATNSWVKIGSNLVNQFGTNLSSTFASLNAGDMAIDGLGRLWIVAANSSVWGLYMLNAPLPKTAQATITLNQEVAPTQPAPGGQFFAGIAYNSTGQIYMSTLNDLYLLNNDLTITHVGTFSVPGVGQDLTSCNYPFSVLPVYLTGFAATLQNNNSVLLTWSISQQVNNLGFSIQRSTDGENWENIGFQVNNPDESSVSYIYIDSRPNSGINYYRIQLISLDGSLSYSIIKTITLLGNKSVSIWPIPSKGLIKIQVPHTSTSRGDNFLIFTPTGQVVFSGLLNEGINTVDISPLLAGDYIIRVTQSNGTTSIQRLVKL